MNYFNIHKHVKYILFAGTADYWSDKKWTTDADVNITDFTVCFRLLT